MVQINAAVRRSGAAVSAVLVASAYPCAAFVIPAASPLMARGSVASSLHAARSSAAPVMMAPRGQERAARAGARSFSSGPPQQLGALGAAIVASATSIPSQAAAAAESVAEVAQASVTATPVGMDQVTPPPLLLPRGGRCSFQLWSCEVMCSRSPHEGRR
jgi:hypothetical protein